MYKLEEIISLKNKTRKIKVVCTTCGVEEAIVVNSRLPHITLTNCTSCGTALYDIIGLLTNKKIRLFYHKFLSVERSALGNY